VLGRVNCCCELDQSVDSSLTGGRREEPDLPVKLLSNFVVHGVDLNLSGVLKSGSNEILVIGKFSHHVEVAEELQ